MCVCDFIHVTLNNFAEDGEQTATHTHTREKKTVTIPLRNRDSIHTHSHKFQDATDRVGFFSAVNVGILYIFTHTHTQLKTCTSLYQASPHPA